MRRTREVSAHLLLLIQTHHKRKRTSQGGRVHTVPCVKLGQGQKVGTRSGESFLYESSLPASACTASFWTHLQDTKDPPKHGRTQLSCIKTMVGVQVVPALSPTHTQTLHKLLRRKEREGEKREKGKREEKRREN